MGRSRRIALSAVFGLLAVAVAWLYGSSVRAEADEARQSALAAYGGDLIEVCVAARDIQSGELLDEANVHIEEWVAELVPAGALTSMEDVAGKRATAPIPGRAVICPLYLEARDGSIEVPAGKVAVSVAADERSAVGGAVGSGDAVDVYVSNDGIADRLCRASVIATSASDKDSTDITWVTLPVEPDEVSEVLAATAKGTVSLALPDASADRSSADTEPDRDLDEGER